jgi:hypothetical protein
MEKTFQENLWLRTSIPHISLAGGIGWGLIGGLIATMVMDIVLMGILSALGLPVLSCFSIVGDTLAGSLSMLGAEIEGSVQLGMVAHYLIGPLLGAIFGRAVVQVGTRRLGTPKKILIFAIVYVEIISQPILAMTPVILKMTALDTLLWFSESFVMHLLWGVILGGCVSYGLWITKMANHK